MVDKESFARTTHRSALSSLPEVRRYWRANFPTRRKTDDGWPERTPNVRPAHHRTLREADIRNRANRAAWRMPSFFQKTRPPIRPHVSRVCETFKVITSLTAKNRISSPRRLKIRNKLRRRLPLRAQTGHKLPNSSNLAPHFTLYALMLSTLPVQHSADCGLARFSRDARRCFWLSPAILRFWRLHGFTASFPRAPCNSAGGRAGGLLLRGRMDVARLGMV